VDYVTRQPFEEEKDLSRLSPAQRKLFADLKTLDTPEIRKRYEVLLDRHRSELAAISPHNGLRELKASLFILHGKVDPIIPAEEAEWTAYDAPKNISVHLYIDPWMHHVSLNAYPPRLQKLELVNYLSTILYAAGLN
jgi:pimeloyl-ACP methyl ester carboxylesterase